MCSRQDQRSDHRGILIAFACLMLTLPASARVRIVDPPAGYTAAQKAQALKDTVEVVAQNGDTIKVRGGPYGFTTSGTTGRKPLKILKDILLWSDNGRVVLDGGAQASFDGDTLCDSCFALGSAENEARCDWAKTTYADSFALIAVNPARVDTSLANASILAIKGFEIRYAFRKVGLWHKVKQGGHEGGGTCTEDTLEFRPGGAIEIWRAKITVDDCYIHHNSVTRYAGQGGGIWAGASNLTVTNCQIEQNYGGYYGGGLFASDGAMGSLGPCCDSATVYPRAAASLTLTNTILRSNFAEFGGGFMLTTVACDSGDTQPGPNPGLELMMYDNLIADNCASRFYATNHTGGSAIYIPSGASVKNMRHNTIVGNKCSDNHGAVLFLGGASVETDSFRLNIIGKNRGAGIHLQCLRPEDNDCAGGQDFCVQNILNQIENNLFYDNTECDGTTDGAHVVLGLGRDRVFGQTFCPDTLVSWTCNSSCDTLTEKRLRWKDDSAIASCASTTPAIETSNKIGNPYFCGGPGSDYEVACCTPAFLLFNGNMAGWKRTACSTTTACPDTAGVVTSSMAVQSEMGPYQGYMTFRFKFQTIADRQAEGFTVKFWKAVPPTRPTPPVPDRTPAACTPPSRNTSKRIRGLRARARSSTGG